MKEIMDFKFFDYETLLARLVHTALNGSKKVVFLLGAPVSAPYKSVSGVPDVEGIVEDIRKEFEIDSNILGELDGKLKSLESIPYQTAMEFYLGHRGQDALNLIIKNAVIKARIDPEQAKHILNSGSNADTAAETLEAQKDKWYEPSCLDYLAKLCKDFPNVFGKLQMTTNFDPLLTLALQRNNVHSFRSVLARDGSLGQTQGDGCHIVHLHGYWHGVDTLHTPRQLNQERPKLRASINQLLKSSIIVPVAYGGWSDIFTKTLIEAINEDDLKHEILWTFYGKNDADLISQNELQLMQFKSGIDSGRLLLYKGVDCHALFLDLYEKVGKKNDKSLPAFISVVKTSYEENSDNTTGINEQLTSSDAIPSVSDLFGRELELANLEDKANKIVAISGLGGQGKSSLAAYHALKLKHESTYDFVDWRDCRELDNTFHTALLLTAHSIFSGAVSMQILKSLSTETLSDHVAKVLSEKRGVVIFDNIDQYVDLESGEPLNALKVFINSLRHLELRSQIIFTSRPPLKIESTNVLSCSLKGLSKPASKSLFELKSDQHLDDKAVSALYGLTEGHPLWISLLAAKCRHEKKPIVDVTAEIHKGKGTLPDKTIASMWNILTDKQRVVLRTIAELERPMHEEEFNQIDFELNYQQTTKAIKALKSYHLLEIREQENNDNLIDIHPLIKQYVRSNFPRTERQKFITKILLVLNRKILNLKNKYNSFIPFDLLEIWIHKVDLCINNSDYDSAISSLDEICNQMIEDGKGEEFIRLAIKIFDNVDLPYYCQNSKLFASLMSRSVKVMVDFGNFNLADKYIDIFERSINGKGREYILICDIKCYRYWFEADFEQAIYYGEIGVKTKNSSNADIPFDCGHNLALAWRDGGRQLDALQYFSRHVDESEILNPITLDEHRGGHFYGNIGRSYYLTGDYEKAEICYKKSAKLLDVDDSDAANLGYIRQWAGELMVKKGQTEAAFLFFNAAYQKWNGLTPGRLNTIRESLAQLIEADASLARLQNTPVWKLEKRFVQWMEATS